MRAQKYIQLKQERLVFVPKDFYIGDVIDERENTEVIGTMNGGGRKEKLLLQKGAAAALSNYLTSSIRQNKSTQRVKLHISKINFDVRKKGIMWHIDAVVAFTFYATDNKLVELSSKGHAEMDADPANYIESFIRQTVEADLKKFDAWWSQNRGTVPTSSTVKIIADIGRTTDKPNTIIYSTRRPLQIADFTGQPEHGLIEMAATFSGIGFAYSSHTENGQIVVDVTVTPYFKNDQSWFKEAGKIPAVLAHEQAHFDITAIKACELVNALRSTTFTKDNYEQLLNDLQQQNADATNDEQTAYDTETNHGIIRDKQDEWAKKVKDQIRSANCFQ